MVFDASVALFVHVSKNTFWMVILNVLKGKFSSYVKPE